MVYFRKSLNDRVTAVDLRLPSHRSLQEVRQECLRPENLLDFRSFLGVLLCAQLLEQLEQRQRVLKQRVRPRHLDLLHLLVELRPPDRPPYRLGLVRDRRKELAHRNHRLRLV